jgi:hypothetical protein
LTESTTYKIRRGEEEFTTAGLEELRAFVRSGRVLESDYVFNPMLEKWMYARELAELADAFKAPRAKKDNKVSWLLFLVSILVGFVWPLAGVILFVVALIYAVKVHLAK